MHVDIRRKLAGGDGAPFLASAGPNRAELTDLRLGGSDLGEHILPTRNIDDKSGVQEPGESLPHDVELLVGDTEIRRGFGMGDPMANPESRLQALPAGII